MERTNTPDFLKDFPIAAPDHKGGIAKVPDPMDISFGILANDDKLIIAQEHSYSDSDGLAFSVVSIIKKDGKFRLLKFGQNNAPENKLVSGTCTKE